MNTKQAAPSPHRKKAARRIARAIYELDNAGWNLSSKEKHDRKARFRVEQARTNLSVALNTLGYEFAACDSPRIKRKVAP